MEWEKHHGFNFYGPDGATELVRTYLPVGQANIEDLLTSAASYAKSVTAFGPVFGTIKEFLMDGDNRRSNYPAKVGAEKNQAFILKRPGEVVTGEGNDYFINDVRLNLGFESYEVHIIDFKD